MEDMEHLATPQMRWLGIHPSDVDTLKLPIDAKLALTNRDRSLIDSMAKRTFFTDNQLLHEQVRLRKFLLNLFVMFLLFFLHRKTIYYVGVSHNTMLL